MQYIFSYIIFFKSLFFSFNYLFLEQSSISSLSLLSVKKSHPTSETGKKTPKHSAHESRDRFTCAMAPKITKCDSQHVYLHNSTTPSNQIKYIYVCICFSVNAFCCVVIIYQSIQLKFKCTHLSVYFIYNKCDDNDADRFAQVWIKYAFPIYIRECFDAVDIISMVA